MKNDKLIQESLFIPLLGRIYTSQNFPEILYDKKVLEIKDKIPDNIETRTVLTQYRYLSGSIRAKKIDSKIDDFLSINPDGVIVELGSKLSTAYYRSSLKNKWYEVNNAKTNEYKMALFKPSDNHIYIQSNFSDRSWVDTVTGENPDSPILIICTGIFSYCEKGSVIDFLRYLNKFSCLEIIFDALNSTGIKTMSRHYKHMGITNPKSMFHIDNVKELKSEIGYSVILDTEPFHQNIPLSKFKFITQFYMKVSDRLNMINLYHIRTE